MRTRFLVLTILVLSYLAIEGRTALAESPAQPAKTVKFTVEGKPWCDVFEWLTQVTGKPVVTDFKPSGKFPCLDLPNKEYTILEVYDTLSTRALQGKGQTQKYYLPSCKAAPSTSSQPMSVSIPCCCSSGGVKRDDLVASTATLNWFPWSYSSRSSMQQKWPRLLTSCWGRMAAFILSLLGGATFLILIDRVGKLKRVGPFLRVLDTVIDPVSHFPRLRR